MSSHSEFDITTNLQAVCAEIAHTCNELGRAVPRLIAVSKTHPPTAIEAAYQVGQREFGENYCQELMSKKSALTEYPDLRFIFIGRLQSNKIKNIVTHADEIQSLASERHAALIAKAAKDLGRVPYPVYYLVNAGSEASKDGLAINDVATFHHMVTTEFPELSPQGLMAIPPLTQSADSTAESVPAVYQSLRVVASRIGAGLLSLGMSSDLKTALLAGTDCVRIGTAIFGAREGAH